MNIVLIQEQLAHIELTLETEDEFEVYGGTTRAPFEFSPTGVASWRVVVRENEVAGAAIRAFDIYARQRSTGREWVVLSGKIIVKPRTADIEGDKLSPVEYHVTVPVVDSVVETQGMAIVTGIPGPQGPKGDKGDPGEGNVTAEAIQAVAPIAWSENSSGATVVRDNYQLAIGEGAKTSGVSGTAVGCFAKTLSNHGSSFGYDSVSNGIYSAAMGYGAKATGAYSVALGSKPKSLVATAVTIGAQFEDTSGKFECTTEGTGSITIGAGANTLNNGDTESSNSVTIGCKALNTGADSVVIGAQAKADNSGSVTIGANSNGSHQTVSIGSNIEFNGWYSVAIGNSAYSGYAYNVVIGQGAKSTGDSSCNVIIGWGAKTAGSVRDKEMTALGYRTTVGASKTIALGADATVSDLGATVIRSTAEDGTYTQLYFSGANTPLANTYHGGAPMLGYVTKDSAGNIVAAGTRSLIDLLTDNSTFQPASLDENGEWVMPKVFHPSDLDMPTEEPSEVEEYTPLPVYTIVEPEPDELRTPTQSD